MEGMVNSQAAKAVQQAGVMVLLIGAALLISTQTGLGLALAQTSPIPLPDSSAYGNLPSSPYGGTAEQQFAQLTWGVVQNARYIIGAVAILIIIVAALKMLLGGGKDDVYIKQRRSILYGVIGLMVIGIGGELANIFAVSCPPSVPGQPNLPCTPGGFLANPNAIIRTSILFDQRTQIIITFLKYLVGAVAILMLVRSGIRMIAMGSAEDKVALDKKNILYAIIGLGVIIIADNVVNNVFFKIDASRYPTSGGAQPGVDAGRGVAELVGFTNFMVSLLAPIAILALLAGGILYMTAAGQEDKMERAKRLIFAALIGILVIYAAFAVVSTFIAGRFEGV